VTDSTGSGERDAEIVRERLEWLLTAAEKPGAATYEMVETWEAEIHAALDRLLVENVRLREYETLIRDAGVAFEDPRLDYIEIQVDRDKYLRLYDALSPARVDSAAERAGQ
jgi:hypothetical protein